VPRSPVWAAVVPVKGGPLAKSRLALPRAVRAALATAFARDTVTALREADRGMPVLVVTGDPDVASWAPTHGAEVVPDPGSGLDAAVTAGVAAAAGRGATHVAVVLGDHPALRPEEVRVALAAVAGVDRAVVPDADGTGTALLTLPAGPGVRTAFGAGSAAEARNALNEDSNYDLVLLDLALGDADGFELLTELRATYPALPVVVVSASDRTSDVIRAIDLGAMGFVVASGLARGIDAAAHRAALPTGTIAAEAGGIDLVYPPENAGLAAEISVGGLRVTEMPPGHAPRNGLARAPVPTSSARCGGPAVRCGSTRSRRRWARPRWPRLRRSSRRWSGTATWS